MMVFTSCLGFLKFEIDFIVDGKVYQTVEMSRSESVRIPADPTKDGYVFDGWYLDEGIWEKPFTANSLLDAPISYDMSMKVYAKWKSLDKQTHTHTPSDWIIDKDSTCSIAGSKHKECIECSEVLETETISITEHTPSEWIIDTESTCKTPGTRHKVCTECGDIIETGVTVVSEDHVLGKWNPYGETGSSCDSKMYFAVCSECGESKWREGTEYDHNYKTVKVEPTCSSEGYDKIICSDCGKYTTANPVKKKEHTWQTSYKYDDFSHWTKCRDCDEITLKVDHTPGEDGLCTVCRAECSSKYVTYALSDDGKYAIVTQYTGREETVKIADSYMGVPVTHIGESAFRSNKQVKLIILPKKVSHIADFAFFGCDYLTNVGAKIETAICLPKTLKYIGIGAFRYCPRLDTNFRFEDASGWWYSKDADGTNKVEIPKSDFTNTGSNPTKTAENIRNKYEYSYLWHE